MPRRVLSAPGFYEQMALALSRGIQQGMAEAYYRIGRAPNRSDQWPGPASGKEWIDSGQEDEDQ